MAMSKRMLNIIATILGACVVGYFLYHTVEGERGWFAMLRLKGEVAAAKDRLSHLQQEHKELDHRVQLMRPNSIDPDLLEEKSREMLDYSKPGELIILTPKDKTDMPQPLPQRTN